MATFKADVTVDGDPAAGTMKISIVQSTTVTPPVEPPPSTAWEPPATLRTDLKTEARPSLAKPAYRVWSVDQVFKTKKIRVSGDPGKPILNIPNATWGDDVRHHYSSDQAWNCNQALLYLENNGAGASGCSELFINGDDTFEPVFPAKGKPSDSDVRWHPKDPALMYFAAGSKFGTWNPKTGDQKVIKDFGSAYSGLKIGPWEGSLSADGDMVVLAGTVNKAFTAFAFKISTGQKWKDIPSSAVDKRKCDNVRISPLGTYIVWNFDPDMVVVTTKEGVIVKTLPEQYVSHIDVIVDGNGDEVLVGRVNRDDVGQGKSGRISKYRLKDGVRTGLSTGGWSTHTSCRAQARKRWSVHAALDTGGNYPPYNDEIIMCELDGSKVYRLGHAYSPKTVDYRAEVQPSHSPDGSRVVFATAWGGSGEKPRPIGCYVIDLRG